MKITRNSEHGQILRKILHLAKFKNKKLEDDMRDWDVAISDNRGESYTALCELEGTPPKAQVIFSLEINVFPHVYIGDIRSNQMYKRAIPNDLLKEFNKLQAALYNHNKKPKDELDLSHKEIKLYYYMPATHLLDVLSNDEIKVSLPEKCNDPLEFLAAGQNTITKPGGFISFSSRKDSSLMWAHYADSHKGVCLEFTFPILKYMQDFGHMLGNSEATTRACVISLDFSEQFSSVPRKDGSSYISQLVEISYCKKRPSYNPVKSCALQTNSNVISFEIAKEYYTKSEEWEYENEWRLMVDPQNAHSFHDGSFFAKGLTKYLTSIFLGRNFAVKNDTAAAMIVQSLKLNPHYTAGVLKEPDIKRAKFDDYEYKIIT